MTNILLVPIAYKLAMAQLMLGEANRIAQDLDLPCKKPILMEEIRRPFVSNPFLVGTPPHFGGTITSSNFNFAFKDGKCWNIVRCNIFPHGEPFEYRDPLPCLAELARGPFR